LDSAVSDSWCSRDIWDAGSDAWITGAAGAFDALMKRPLLSLGGAMVSESGRARPNGTAPGGLCLVSGFYR
jgi:hypothetical protein